MPSNRRQFYFGKNAGWQLLPLKTIGALVLFLTIFSVSNQAQTKCFTEDEKKSIIASIGSPQKIKDLKSIRAELIKLDSDRKSLENNILGEKNNNELLVKRRALLQDGIQRLCTIYKENGWLKKETLGAAEFSAEMDLIFGAEQPAVQREFLSILLAAAEKGEVKLADIATLVDSIRVASGMPQLFGTYLAFNDGTVYLYPLENEKMVDEWRKTYELPTLNSFMREIETKYQTLVIKRDSPRRNPVAAPADAPKTDTKVLGLADDDEVVKVATNLVNVKVRVTGGDSSQSAPLEVKDFVLTEDDKPQEISFFEKDKQPIDYYLILDLSGSTARIRETIWKTVGILAALLRPGDRITVLTHIDNDLRPLLDLTANRDNISETVARFRGLGSSSIWDALDDAFDLIAKRDFKGRSAALILITDGIETDSKLAFGNLLSRVRENEIMIFPIQLPTDYLAEDPTASKKRLSVASRALELLAGESGGEYFNIKKDGELPSIPEKIINGLTEIYDLGFEPLNANLDGSWRRLKVKMASRDDLRVRAKTGYYAKP